MDPNPHDLLWTADATALSFDGPRPDWPLAGPVVVRRETRSDGLLPVGLRGATRSQRCKAYLPAHAVLRRVTPEMLALDAHGRRSFACRDARGQSGYACLNALAMLAPLFDTLDLAWGPTGGVGFFLASGLPVLRPDSDLDVLVRAPQPLTTTQVAILAGMQAAAPCRIDIQVDTGIGAFALAEWLRQPRQLLPKLLLKTGAGPLLVTDPWSLP